MADVYYDQVVLHLPGNGIDNSGYIYDIKNHNISKTGTPTLKSNNKKFGPTSIYFDGNTDLLMIGPTSEFNLNNCIFTIDFFINFESFNTTTPHILQIGTSGTNRFAIFRWSDGYLYLYKNTSSVSFTIARSLGILNINQWYHIAVTSDLLHLNLFIDGILQAQYKYNNTLLPNSSNYIHIGWQGWSGGANDSLKGWVDDFRITKGVNRYSIPVADNTIPFSSTDDYWDNVVLLCHMDGENNGTIFTDEKNHILSTYSGSPITKTDLYKFNNSSLYLNGSSILQTNSSIDFAFGSQDFTIEFWFYPQITGNQYPALIANSNSWVTNAWSIAIDHASYPNKYAVFSRNYNSSAALLISASSIVYDTWHQITFIRKGSFWFLYLNGICESWNFSSFTIDSATLETIYFGSQYLGYIDEVRITKGIARGNVGKQIFTVPIEASPTSKLIYSNSYSKNLKLLMHMDSAEGSTEFKNEANYGVTGSSAITASTSIYKTGTASTYFPGTNNTIKLLTNNNELALVNADGNSDFTIEAYVYFNSFPTSANEWFVINNSYTSPDWRLHFIGTATTPKLRFSYSYNVTSVAYFETSALSIATNEWCHVAVCRSNNIVRIFINGTQNGLDSTWVYDPRPPTTSISSWSLGGGVTSYPDWYLDSIRVLIGQANYTSNFDPNLITFDNPSYSETPYDPYWNNVVLFMPMEGDIIDEKNHEFTVVGQSSLVSTDKKFGNTSLYFDGSGDQIYSPSSIDFDFGTNDFTIEFWYKSLETGATLRTIFDTRSISTDTGLQIFQQGTITTFTSNSIRATTSVTIRALEWHHLALTRVAGNLRLYIDGVGYSFVSYASAITCPGTLKISNTNWYGYIDSIRITKGISRYNSSFQIPTCAFFRQIISNMSDLLFEQTYKINVVGDQLGDLNIEQSWILDTDFIPLLQFGTSFDKWNHRISPNQGYIIEKDVYLDPLSNSNLADLVKADANAYGGLETEVTIQPNTEYYFKIWTLIPVGKFCEFSFRLNQDSTFGSVYWPGVGNTGTNPTEVYTSPIPGDWTLYTWQFTTPVNLDANTPTKIAIRITGSPDNNPTLSQLVLFGAWLDTTDTIFKDRILYTYDVDTIDSSLEFFDCSIDELDINGNPLTLPFDPTRYGFVDYNLIKNNLGLNFQGWRYTPSNLPATPGYTVYRDNDINPFGTSNLADRIVSDDLSYGGLKLDVYLQPNYTYTFSVYSKRNSGSDGFALRLWTEPTGVVWWDPNNIIGFINYAIYVYPSTDGYERYNWTFTIPGNIPDPVLGSNGELSIYIAANANLYLYGASLVVGTSLYDFVEPYLFIYDSLSIPTGNYIDSNLEFFYPDINELNSNGDLIYSPFDPFRLATFTRLGKHAIPYGNTFDVLINDELGYYLVENSGSTIIANQDLTPNDPIYNPNPDGYHSDLLQGSSDPNKLNGYSGVSILWPMPTTLVEGVDYTVSIWIKAKYLETTAFFNIIPSGTWFNGIEVANSQGNFSHSSWKFLNGSIQIPVSEITGTYPTIGDLGIPDVIPADKILVDRRADKIKAISDNSSSSFWVTEDYQIYDLNVATNLSDILTRTKNSVVVYQEIPYNSEFTSYGAQFWLRLASEYSFINAENQLVYALDNNVVGDLVGLAVVITDTTGRKITRVHKNYNTLTTDWRSNQYYFSINMASSFIDPDYPNTTITQDITKPVGVGFVFSGDLAIYGGPRIFDNTFRLSQSMPIYPNTWTRLSYSFKATKGMQYTLTETARPGTSNPLTFSYGSIGLKISINQPYQPQLNGNPDPAYEPWAPIWTSSLLYGLMINEGTTPDVYYADFLYVPNYPIIPIENRSQVFYPTLEYISGDIEIQPFPIKSISETPQHNVGINVTGNHFFSTARIFLNLLKVSNAGRYRSSVDYYGVWPKTPVQGWWLYRDASVNGNGIDSRWDCFDTRIVLSNVEFESGDTILTVSKSSSGWPSLFGADLFDKTVLGTNIANNTKFVSATVDDINNKVYIEIDTPTIGSSDINDFYYIKKEVIDTHSDLNMDENGYPRYIPTGYQLSCISYRLSAPWNYVAGQMNHPVMPSGRYVLKWDGEGTIHMNNTVGLSAGPYPVTEISSSSNRIVYDIDCSGNTSNGDPVHIKYALGSDIPTPNWTQAQSGFLIVISSTNPDNHIRNIRLVEEKYESLLDSGEVFYPEWLDRLKYFKCIRYLDWCKGNTFQAISRDISERGYIDDVSWSGADSNIPWEIIIEQCNKTNTDCWINLHPAAPDDYQLEIAKIFRDNLNPNLRIYAEFGNEQWNGGLGTGWWLNLYADKFNIEPDPNAANLSWDSHLKAYAMLSQRVFAIWDSVFSGEHARLYPVKLWDDPKTQQRRFLRVLSTISANPSVAIDVWKYAVQYTKDIDGIPYDVIGSNAYFADMLSPEIKHIEEIHAPLPYQWTLEEVIPHAWIGLEEFKTNEGYHFDTLLNNNGELGNDLNGDPVRPTFCFYEGGFGCPGPSPYMFKAIAQLKFGEDGLDTVYNLYKQQLQWWQAKIENSYNKDVSIYNIWETPNSFSTYDQWGITDKSYYPEYEYLEFPKVKATIESSGLYSNVTLEFNSPVLIYSSKPKININNQWVALNTVKIKQNGIWRTAPSYIIKYKMNDVWN